MVECPKAELTVLLRWQWNLKKPRHVGGAIRASSSVLDYASMNGVTPESVPILAIYARYRYRL